MPRKECYDQKHKTLEVEIDRLKRHIQLLKQEVNTLRTFNKEYEEFVVDIRDNIKVVSKEMYLGAEGRGGMTPEELRSLRNIIDPYGLIMTGVLR